MNAINNEKDNTLKQSNDYRMKTTATENKCKFKISQLQNRKLHRK